MNRGVLRGIGQADSTPWVPTLRAGTTDPTMGAGVWAFGSRIAENTGTYKVMNGWCIGHCEFMWGSGGSAGSGYYYVPPPVPAQQPECSPSNDYFCGAGMVGRVLGSRDAPVTVYMSRAPWGEPCFTLLIGQMMTEGTATVPVSASTVTVAHALGQAPAAIHVTPRANVAMTGPIWVDGVTATSFVIHAGTQALAAGLDFYWTARAGNGAVVVADNIPWTWGANADHIEFNFLYPIA